MTLYRRAFVLALLAGAILLVAAGSPLASESIQAIEPAETLPDAPHAAASPDVYSPGGWATLHRGPANRKLVPDAPLADAYRIWTALRGAAVLTAPTMSPDGRTLYVTTGRAAGHSNLHAFDLDGRLLWRAEPFRGPEDGVDPCAILSSPIVDREGDIYIGDCNQLFAFHPNGQTKWVVPLPPLQEGDWSASDELPVNALTTAVFTRQGHVLGVTNMGDVLVVDRRTGRSLAGDFRLPGHLPPASTVESMPESVFSGALVDPRIREWSWQLLFGGAMRSANTPAVDMESGRVYVAATSTTRGKGALYALDPILRQGRVELELAFATEMGPGSGSSPSLSPSGDAVYVSDETGVFYSVDARSGELRWQAATRATSAAAAVGANGDIYALQADGPALIAISDAGEIRWESDLAGLARRELPKGLLLGEPKAIGNGNPTVVGDRVLVPIAYGYETRIRRRIPWPVSSFLVAVDARTGEGVRNVVALEDDSTGVTSVLPDGTLVNSLGTAVTSAVMPLSGAAEWLLPGDLRPMRPVGGIQISRPLAGDALERRRTLAERLGARSEEDRVADPERRPLRVLEAAGVAEGMQVADLMTGDGWYAEVLARAVGPTGRVFAQNNGVSDSRHGEALAARLAGARQSAIEPVLCELEELPFEAGSLDAAFLVQFYHDTVWMGVDRRALNRRVFEALAPGGVFLVIDHHAPVGSGTEYVESLHRIDEGVVVREVEAAGFRLERSSSLLARSADDREKSVFDPRIRGQTDRFLLRFVKPRELEGTASGG